MLEVQTLKLGVCLKHLGPNAEFFYGFKCSRLFTKGYAKVPKDLEISRKLIINIPLSTNTSNFLKLHSTRLGVAH